MIDTTEAGGGSYPIPKEEKVKTITGAITLTYSFQDDEVPFYWNEDDIIDYIKNNYREYMQELENIEIEINEEEEE